MLPKKSLGQNFLTNKSIVASIVDAAGVSSGETVLEIGPGKGILTQELLDRGAKVIAVEKDSDLIELLNSTFKFQISNKQLVLINGDILDFKFQIPDSPYKLVANIPYYITGQIIRKFLTTQNQPEKIALLVQKEVAERIIARDKKESLLSISVKAYGTPFFIKTVKAGAFTPVPKVDSAILLVDGISRDFFKGISEERFFEILHAGFAHKRKQLSGNLKAVFGDSLQKKLADCDISPKARAEDLSLSEWKSLSTLE
jgi:16S rRNA (adenine1518-N6/adenine1519-N6)-dimethyltransferase